MIRPVWTKIAARVDEGGPSLQGQALLTALFRWLRGEAPPEIAFIDQELSLELFDALEVDWRNFPLQDAIEAVRAERIPVLSDGASRGDHMHLTAA
jgi:hypothetical protein